MDDACGTASRKLHEKGVGGWVVYSSREVVTTGKLLKTVAMRRAWFEAAAFGERRLVGSAGGELGADDRVE